MTKNLAEKKQPTVYFWVDGRFVKNSPPVSTKKRHNAVSLTVIVQFKT